jgi:tRNA threonylcarbamoyladenosine modification (KEOPS) complex  Pcc1 subunit
MKAIASALEPELQHPAGEKAKARLLHRGNRLTLEFEARDSTAFRAIMSSYIRMLKAGVNVSGTLIQLERSRGIRKGDKPDL